jgi:dihydroorotase
VIDPSQKLDAVTDVAFSGGKVAQIGPGLKADAETDVHDLSGFIVTPGLIDLHTHVYWGGTSLGIDAETSVAARVSQLLSMPAARARATSPDSAST